MPLEVEHKIEIWKRSIETQMHFAELSIKMRQIGLTLAGATIALAIVLYRTNTDFSFDVPLTDISVPVGTILSISAAAILYAASIIDVGVYHRMLRGAVKFNELHEQSLDVDVLWKSGLTEAISAYSRFEKPVLHEERNSKGSHWSAEKKTRSAEYKIRLFYRVCITSLLFAAIALAFAENTK